jgi:hypothetical protein
MHCAQLAHVPSHMDDDDDDDDDDELIDRLIDSQNL